MANKLDDFRGMSPSNMQGQNDKTKVNNNSSNSNEGNSGDEGNQNQNNNQSQQSNSDSGNQNNSQQQSGQNNQNNNNQQGSSQNNKEGDDDFERERKLLINTFGYSPDEIDEKAIKVAKSYLKSQSGYSTKAQELSEAQQAVNVVQNMNQFFEQNPDIYRQIQKRRSGEEGNSQQQEPEGKPNNQSTERKLKNITERELVKEGYLEEGELEGLDELQRAERLIDAKTELLTQRKLEQFDKKLEERETAREQKIAQKRVKAENDKRIEDGFERLVVEHGVDFEQVPDNVMANIRKRAVAIKDPADPNGNLIDKDAYYDAGLKELVKAGYVKLDNRLGIQDSNSNNNNQNLSDTGADIGSNNDQNKNKRKTVHDRINEANKKRWNSVIDQSSRFEKFKQKVN